MMTILIVEDELLIAEMLKELLDDLNYNSVYIAKNYDDAKVILSLHNVDLAFLDINLSGEKTGIDIANFIKETYKIPYIYLTSYSDPKTVKKAIETLPEAYLIKPFNKNSLYSTLEIVKVRNEIRPTAFITIKEGTKSIKLVLNELLFIRSDKNYLEVFTTSKRYVIRLSIDDFITELDSSRFIRTHRSFAINIDKIDNLSSKEVTINNQSIPLSRKHKAKLYNLYHI